MNLFPWHSPDLQRELIDRTFLRAVDVFSVLSSTSDYALQVLRGDPSLETPRLVLAERQEKGRGRGDNQWWASAGALTFSLIVDAERLEIRRARWPLLSLMSAIAVRDVLTALEDPRQDMPASDVQLKWPNDVYLAKRKVAGILVEVPSDRRRQIVVGIGLNVNNSMRDAPESVAKLATTIRDERGQPVGAHALLVELLQVLERRFTELVGDGEMAMESLWNPHCYLRGRTVSVEAGRQVTNGWCEGINSEGALLLRQADGARQACVAGTVVMSEGKNHRATEDTEDKR